MPALSASARLARCHNIADLRALARRRLPDPIFQFLDGGAEDETTLRRNSAAFETLALIPRGLVDVSAVTTTTRVLGQQLDWPVFCGPTGTSRFFHPEGELAVARAAAKAGTLYGLSIAATQRLEEVAAVSDGAKMFPLYIFKDRSVTHELVRRCRQSGYGALCLTIDTAVVGKRERDLRSGWGIPINLSAKSMLSFACHPVWLLGLLGGGPLSIATIAEISGNTGIADQMRYIGAQLDPGVTWKDVRAIIDLWGGPFAIKGVMAADDARAAVDAGASAIIVSNHGGRQLDGAAAAIEALPDIVAAVGDRAEIILDGGIRRGSHVLKALALGARACSIGRPYLYGLAAGGEKGVGKALDILRAEFVRALQLCGCAAIDHIDRTILHKAQP